MSFVGRQADREAYRIIVGREGRRAAYLVTADLRYDQIGGSRRKKGVEIINGMAKTYTRYIKKAGGITLYRSRIVIFGDVSL